MKKMLVLTVMVLTAALVFSSISISLAEEQKGVRIENGKIFFPEQNVITVELSQLKFNFPQKTPKEILERKEKLFRGEFGGSLIKKTTNYVILTSYDSDLNEITLQCVWEKGVKGEPLQVRLRGSFDPEGSTLNLVPPGPITWRLYFLKNGNISLRGSHGAEGDFTAIALFPIP